MISEGRGWGIGEGGGGDFNLSGIPVCSFDLIEGRNGNSGGGCTRRYKHGSTKSYPSVFCLDIHSFTTSGLGRPANALVIERFFLDCVRSLTAGTNKRCGVFYLCVFLVKMMRHLLSTL